MAHRHSAFKMAVLRALDTLPGGMDLEESLRIAGTQWDHYSRKVNVEAIDLDSLKVELSTFDIILQCVRLEKRLTKFDKISVIIVDISRSVLLLNVLIHFIV